MILSLLRMLLPWSIYYTLTLSNHPVENSAMIALLIFIILAYNDLKNKYILSWLTCIFFMLIIFNAAYIHLSYIQYRTGAFFYTILTIISYGSILIKKPFTLQYSKKYISAARWKHPIFLKINYILTFAWSLTFSINLLIYCLSPNTSNSVYLRLTSLFLSITTMSFAAIFPDWYRNNAAKKSFNSHLNIKKKIKNENYLS